MKLFPNLTPEQRNKMIEERAKIESEHLSNDVMCSFENRIFEVSDIKNSEGFERLIHCNVDFFWDDGLLDFQTRYYEQVYNGLNIEEKDKYICLLLSFAKENLVNRFTKYIKKHPDCKRVIIKMPDIKNI